MISKESKTFWIMDNGIMNKIIDFICENNHIDFICENNHIDSIKCILSENHLSYKQYDKLLSYLLQKKNYDLIELINHKYEKPFIHFLLCNNLKKYRG